MNDRVVTLLAAENFDGAVGDDFVGVHVRGGACASLDWVAQELVMELTGNDLIAGLADGVLNLFVHLAYHAVADCTGFFDLSHRVDELRLQLLAGDVEVFRAAQRLYAIVSVNWDFSFTDGVFFNTVFHCFQPSHFIMIKVSAASLLERGGLFCFF